jgi:hypothetical protein
MICLGCFSWLAKIMQASVLQQQNSSRKGKGQYI